MKRYWMGVLWFVAIFVTLWLVFSVVLSLVIKRDLPANDSTQQMTDALLAYAGAHAAQLSAARWGIFLLSLLVAVVGTLKGLLPGTRKPQA